jgi:Flp pilus assembly pilin Flp
MKRWPSAGQSVLEYAILLAIVSAAFITMTVYVRRAIQGQLYQIEEKATSKAKGNTSTTTGSGGILG